MMIVMIIMTVTIIIIIIIVIKQLRCCFGDLACDRVRYFARRSSDIK